MNYITEINSFYNWVTFNPIPPDAQALWHVLMQMNNRCAVCIKDTWYWRTEFSIPNITLLSILAFSRQQLDRMRNVLIQTGRIMYKKGRGSHSGTYKIIPFDTSLAEKIINNQKVWVCANNVTQIDTQVDTQSGHNADTNESLCNIFGTLINSNNKNNTASPVFKSYESLIGVITPRVVEILDSFNISDELKIKAIEEAHDNNAKTIRYIESILRRYESEGINVPADARRRRGTNKDKQKQSNYDFDEIERLEFKRRCIKP